MSTFKLAHQAMHPRNRLVFPIAKPIVSEQNKYRVQIDRQDFN